MAVSDNHIAEAFKQRIVKKINNEVYEKMLAKMERAAAKIASNVGKYVKFYDITGNLFNSIAVGVYYKSNLVSIVHADGGKVPTRDTLAKGEKYNLPYYYGGAPSCYVEGSKNRSFVGRVGFGGQTPQSTDNLLRFSLNPAKNNSWTLIVATGIEYASYVEKLNGHSVLIGIRDYVERYYRTM